MSKFKVGDKVRFRLTQEEWQPLFDKWKSDKETQEVILSNSLIFSQKYPEPIKVIHISDYTCDILADNGQRCVFNLDYFLLAIEDKPKPSGYYTTFDGFQSNPDNWKPGALGIL